jgi:hypothetical protein
MLPQEVGICHFLTDVRLDEMAVAKMKDILASQFDIEIEYKTQKIQEVVEAIQKVESMWYELQVMTTAFFETHQIAGFVVATKLC